MAQKSLFDVGFGGGQKRINDSESLSSTPTKRGKTEAEVGTPKSQVKRKFRAEWLMDYEWLETSEKDGQVLMFCSWCRCAKKNNPFAQSGSSNQHGLSGTND